MSETDELIGMTDGNADETTASAEIVMRYFIELDDDFVVIRTTMETSPDHDPEGYIEVSREIHDAVEVGRVRFVDGAIEPYEPPAPPLPPIVLSADVLFFDRMTDDEYDDLDASVRAGETARVYRGWAAATSFTEGSDMWALLMKHLDAIGATAARKDELLARPIAKAAMAEETVAA